MAECSSAGLPTPTGPYGVGCIDIMSPEDSYPLVRLFYPSEPNVTAVGEVETCYWFPHAKYVRAYVEFLRLSPVDEVADDISRRCNPAIPAVYNAPLRLATAETTGQLSVVVFSHGRGGMRTRYSAICCDLASHGHVVAVPEHGDMSASVALRLTVSPQDGSIEEKWLPYRWTNAGESETELRIEQVKHRTTELSTTLDLLHSLNDGRAGNLMEGSLTSFVDRLNLSFSGWG